MKDFDTSQIKTILQLFCWESGIRVTANNLHGLLNRHLREAVLRRFKTPLTKQYLLLAISLKGAKNPSDELSTFGDAILIKTPDVDFGGL